MSAHTPLSSACLACALIAGCSPSPQPPSPAASHSRSPASASASASSPSPSPSSSPSSSSSSSPSSSASASVPLPPSSAAADAGASPAERAVVAALKKDHAALVACHRAAKTPNGDMTVQVTLGPNGKVEATAIGARLTVPSSLAQCIEDRVRRLRVDTSPVTVPIPFHFTTSVYDGPTVHYGSGPFDPGY